MLLIPEPSRVPRHPLQLMPTQLLPPRPRLGLCPSAASSAGVQEGLLLPRGARSTAPTVLYGGGQVLRIDLGAPKAVECSLCRPEPRRVCSLITEGTLPRRPSQTRERCQPNGPTGPSLPSFLSPARPPPTSPDNSHHLIGIRNQPPSKYDQLDCSY